MAHLNTYTCDCCGKLKGETNHWFIFRLDLTSAPGAQNRIVITPFDDHIIEPDNANHLCGRECVQKIVEQNLEKL